MSQGEARTRRSKRESDSNIENMIVATVKD